MYSDFGAHSCVLARTRANFFVVRFGVVRMSEQAIDLSIPIKSVGSSTPPRMPPRLPDPANSEQPLAWVTRPERATRANQVEPRTMIVGNGVALSGDIRFCDRLVIQGDLEASIHECRELEISGNGIFRGNATVATADIRGRFEGDLVVRKRVVVHSTAHVSGSITYGELEIQRGAQVAGILMPETEKGRDFLPPAFATRSKAEHAGVD